jgi:hypothetical protein
MQKYHHVEHGRRTDVLDTLDIPDFLQRNKDNRAPFMEIRRMPYTIEFPANPATDPQETFPWNLPPSGSNS